MVEEMGTVMSGNSTSTTQVSTDLEVTNTSDKQFKNEIHLDRYSKEPANKLSSPNTSSSSHRRTSNDDRNTSRDSLSYSVLSQVAKRPLDGTPRTSTPEPRPSVSPRQDPASSDDFKSKHFIKQENLYRPMLQFQTTEGSYRVESYKEGWYFDILGRMEDLSWSYQKLETEYDFLERFMDEQKEDLKKVKNCRKHLRNRADLNASKGVH